jgi:peptide/nickel transport system permease protein
MSENMNENTSEKNSNTPLRNMWKRLKRNHLAMFGLAVMAVVFVVAVFAPYITPYGYAQQDLTQRFLFPCKAHPFGTDNFGRDILSRIMYGSRYTLLIGFGCITVATIVGSLLGALAGFYPKLDNFIMRLVDIVMGIPVFMLALSIITSLGPNLKNMMVALCITSTPMFVRVVRAQVLVIKQQEFIESTRSIGANDPRILFRHILPNALAPIIVQYTLGVGNVILWGASLSFIGMGVQAPTPEWGLMISAGRTYLRSYWYMSIIPGLAIILVTYALNVLGDGLRDALDPKLNQ